MARTRQQNVTAAQWSANGARPRRARPHPARQLGLRRQRLLAGRPAPAPAQGRLQAAAGDARARRGARPVARRRRRRGDEGLGDGEGRDPLHALVPAADRLDRREARLLLRARPATAPRSPSSPARSSSRASPTRPRSRPAASARPSRRAATPPGTRRRRPSSSRTPTARCCASRPRSRRGRARRWTTRSRCCARWTRSSKSAVRALRLLGDDGRPARLHDGRPRAGVLPDRRAVLLRAPRPHPRRAARCSAPSRRRATSSTTTTSARSPSAILACMLETERELAKLGVPVKTRHNEVAPEPVRDRADLRELQRRLRPPAADDAGACRTWPAATASSACCTRSPSPASTARASTTTGRWAPTRAQPARAGRHAAREPPVPVLLRGGHRGGQQAPGAAARVGRLRRPGPPPRAPTRRRRRSSRSSSAPSCAKVFEAIEAGEGDAATPARLPRAWARRCCRRCRCTAATATAPRRSPSPATSSSSARSGSSMSLALPNTVLNTIVAEAIDDAGRRSSRASSTAATSLEEAVARGRQGRYGEQQADRLRRRQLLRGVARRGRAARAGQPAHDARRAAVARRGADGRRVLALRRALRARARVPLRGVRRAVRDASSTSRPRPPRRSPARCSCRRRCAPRRCSTTPARRRREPPATEADGLVDEFVDAIFALEKANAVHPARARASSTPSTCATTSIPAMDAVREVADRLERVVADDLWPLPKYSEMLFIK